ncbi:MAG: hypothetical protein Q9220_006721 [cf. Caloplaca sp. 1 TL-2023]
MLASGAYISITGIAAPIILMSTAMAMISAELLHTFDIGTPKAKWIKYQVIGGVGLGIASQIPITTVQATAPASDLAEATAIFLFFQTVGGAFVVSAAQAALVNILLKDLHDLVPGVNPLSVVNTGATDLRKVFPKQISGILTAYMDGLKATFLVALDSSSIALARAWDTLDEQATTLGTDLINTGSLILERALLQSTG